jgi:MoxR-like ATPase
LHGRPNVACEDVKALALPVLRHRLLTNFHADAEGITTDDVINRLIKETPEPQG